MPAAKNKNKPEFEAAMERLLSFKVIECDAALWRGDDRQTRQGIRLVEGGK